MPESHIEILETYRRHRMPVAWGARIDDAKRVCAAWFARFGRALVYRLNDERLRLLMRRLVDERFTAEQLGWAIVAYQNFCEHDPWHQRNPDARKSFENFLADERLEDWVARGEELAARRAAESRRADARAARTASESEISNLQSAFSALPAERREAEIRAAIAEHELRTGRPLIGPHDWSNPFVRSLVFRRLQARAGPRPEVDRLNIEEALR